jgi:hypothetical protein
MVVGKCHVRHDYSVHYLDIGMDKDKDMDMDTDTDTDTENGKETYMEMDTYSKQTRTN